MKNKNPILLTTLLLTVLLSAIALPIFAAPPNPLGLLDPKAIPKFVNELTAPPPVYVPTIQNNYTVEVNQFMQQILPPGFPMTKVWGYGGMVRDPLNPAGTPYPFQSAPGATFEAVRGVPINVTWKNNIDTPHIFPVDPTLHWADPNMMMNNPPTLPFNPYPPGYADAQYPVPLIPHLHGGEVHSTSDGHPEAWFTSATSPKFGAEFSTNGVYQPTSPTPGEAVFYYPNMQPPTTLWYHDHALGITRINVLSGLAGFYILRDPTDTTEQMFTNAGIGNKTKYDMPLVIQDRTFYTDGSFFFDTLGINPTIHPYWMPEFFGNTIMVNGKVWPFMKVDQGMYRFRLLDGSNARFYTLSFVAKNKNLPFAVIGTDGGYLQTAATGLTELTIAPGERYDILIDFSGLKPGDTVLVKNTARAPFKGGAGGGTPPDPQTVGQVMQFVVTANLGKTVQLPTTNLNPTLPGTTFPTLPAPGAVKKRILTLVEVMGPAGPVEVLLDGQKWANAITEAPMLGDTEDWVIVNPTADTHPIHLHLVQFQIISRQPFRSGPYLTAWMTNNMPLMNPVTMMPPLSGKPIWPGDGQTGLNNLAPYLQKTPVLAGPGVFITEHGWKDTIQMNPGEVTTIRVRFKPIDWDIHQTGAPLFGYQFDPTTGPGYVWHCHILDHEDNEMMRPYTVSPYTAPL